MFICEQINIHTRWLIFTVENLKCNFSALHFTSTDPNEWINSLLNLAQMTRQCDSGNNQIWQNTSEKSIAIDYLNSEFQGTQAGFILSQTPVGAFLESI